MKMNCMRFENSQQFRIRCNRLGSGAGSDDSISARPRFREDMAAVAVTKEMEPNPCNVEVKIESEKVDGSKRAKCS